MSDDTVQEKIGAINSKGDSTRDDFFGALKAMLSAYDSLEQEKLPIKEYPHSEFACYFTKRLKELHQSKELTPFNIARIPFEIANGKRNGISETKKTQNADYINALISLYKESIHDSIFEHLESLNKLEKGSRIFDFENKSNHPNWKGWLPSTWENKSSKGEILPKIYENIGKEFNFTYSVARFHQLCEKQKISEPAKGKCVEYFFDLEEIKPIESEEGAEQSLRELRTFLLGKFPKDIPIDYFKDNLKYFNPHNLTVHELNTFFEWSICLCVDNKEQSNLPFFKEIWILGKLYNVNIFPLDFLKITDSKINDSLLIKIRGLRKHLLNEKIVFPKPQKIKSVTEDWNKTIRFLGFFAFQSLIPVICNIHSLQKEAEVKADCADIEIIEKNVSTIKESLSGYPFLDWIELDLDRPKDPNHRLLSLITKAACLYFQRPVFYGNLLRNHKHIFLRTIKKFSDIINSDTRTDNLPIFKENIDDSVVPIIFSLIGLLERILYPSGLLITSSSQFIQEIESLKHYASSQENFTVLEFRFKAIMGRVFQHPKIIRYLTCCDFIDGISPLKELGEICVNLTPFIIAEAKKTHQANVEEFKSIDRENLDENKKIEYDQLKQDLENNGAFLQIPGKFNELSDQLRLTSEKMAPEIHPD